MAVATKYTRRLGPLRGPFDVERDLRLAEMSRGRAEELGATARGFSDLFERAMGEEQRRKMIRAAGRGTTEVAAKAPRIISALRPPAPTSGGPFANISGAGRANVPAGFSSFGGAAPTSTASALPAGAVEAATKFGEPGAVGSTAQGAAGTAGRLGTALRIGGGALGAASGVYGAIESEDDIDKALSSAQAAASIAAMFPAATPIAAPIAAVIGIAKFLKGLFGGGRKVPHAVREAREIGDRIHPESSLFMRGVNESANFSQLFNVINAWQAGRPRGTFPGTKQEGRGLYGTRLPDIPEVRMDEGRGLYGVPLRPPGVTGRPMTFEEQFTMIPPWDTTASRSIQTSVGGAWPTSAAALEEALKSPAGRESLNVNVLAGVTPGLLEPYNTAIRDAILSKANQLSPFINIPPIQVGPQAGSQAPQAGTAAAPSAVAAPSGLAGLGPGPAGGADIFGETERRKRGEALRF